MIWNTLSTRKLSLHFLRHSHLRAGGTEAGSISKAALQSDYECWQSFSVNSKNISPDLAQKFSVVPNHLRHLRLRKELREVEQV